MTAVDTLATGHLAAAVTARLRPLGTAGADEAMGMSEARLMTATRRLIRAHGHHAYHTHRSDHSDKGFPDLVIVGRGGVLFRELKTETGRLTGEQVAWLRALAAAGADAGVWRPCDLLSHRISGALAALRAVRG